MTDSPLAPKTPLDTLKAQLATSEAELETLKANLYRTDGAIVALKFAIAALDPTPSPSEVETKDSN